VGGISLQAEAVIGEVVKASNVVGGPEVIGRSVLMTNPMTALLRR
jgi:hypothetical protein